MKKIRPRGIRWIAQGYYTASKWTTGIPTSVYILIPKPCHVPLTIQGLVLLWLRDITDSLLLLIFLLLLVDHLIFCHCFYPRAKTCYGIHGVAVEIKCSNLRDCVSGYLWIGISPYCLFLPPTPSYIWRLIIRLFSGVLEHAHLWESAS